MTKRVLLIAWTYYPLNASGAHRSAKLAKYLPQFGWTPVVLCPDWKPDYGGNCYDPGLAAKGDACRTLRVPYQGRPRTRAGRALNRLERLLLPYRSPWGLTTRMVAAAERLVAEEAFDVIWSSANPGMPHFVAGRIARRHGIPWVADFRDLPDQASASWVARWAVRAERRVCAAATALVTVSRPLADRLASRHAAPVHVIYNGFDPDDFPPDRTTRSEKFTVTYFGILYLERDPRPMFAALDLLAERREMNLDDVQVLFYGSNAGLVRSLASAYRCQRVVEAKDRIAHAAALRLQQDSVVLLVLSFRHSRGMMTGKVFEYLAAGRPILNVPGDGDVVDALLEETRAGVSAGDPDAIARILKAWYDEWKQTGWVAGKGIPERVARYSRREQAEQFARLFDSVRRA